MSEEYYSKSNIMNALLYNLSEAEAKEMMITIEVIGSADVAPVVHGRWEVVYNSVGKQEGQCTHCGKNSGILITKKSYCPHCGAKMDEREDNDSE